MSKEREKQMDFMPLNCGEDCVGSSLPKLWLVMMMCGYVTGFLQLFISNQID